MSAEPTSPPARIAGAPRPPRIVFLLGAGASKPAEIPLTVDFVDAFKQRLASADDAHWLSSDDRPALRGGFDKLCARLQSWSDASENGRLDIEAVYEALVLLAEKPRPALVGTEADIPPLAEAKRLRDLLERLIREKGFAREGAVGYLEPLAGFAAAFGTPLEVFTTNYDTCVELVAERLGLDWEDGFATHWDPRMFTREGVAVRIHKLHGSVLWYRDQFGNYLRAPVRAATAAAGRDELFSGPSLPLLIYPARKEAYDAPFAHNVEAFRRALGRPDSSSGGVTILIVIGYSFRDQSINTLLHDAGRENPGLRIVLVDPGAEATYRDKLKVRRVEGLEPRPSPLADRVLRVNCPLSKGKELLTDLHSRVVPAYVHALGVEAETAHLMASGQYHSWEAVAYACLAADDLAGYSRAAKRTTWEAILAGWNKHAELMNGLREFRLWIEAGHAPPEGRKLVNSLNGGIDRTFGRFEFPDVPGPPPGYAVYIQTRWPPEHHDRMDADQTGYLYAELSREHRLCAAHVDAWSGAGDRARASALGSLRDLQDRLVRAIRLANAHRRGWDEATLMDAFPGWSGGAGPGHGQAWATHARKVVDDLRSDTIKAVDAWCNGREQMA